MKKIFPRNLAARAAHRVAGNSDGTRLESGVGNCFPGLEFDVRNLDRRFFPGIVWQFVTDPMRPVPEAPKNQAGCRAKYVDYIQDPMLPAESKDAWVQKLRDDLRSYFGPVSTALDHGRWYIDWIEQGNNRLNMWPEDKSPLDGEAVWRLVRGLELDKPIKLSISDRDEPRGSAGFELEGYRRRYVSEKGLFDASYRAGELTQSLCNPWSHDFRDCGCHYWASNHPDIVLPEIRARTSLPDGDAWDAQRAYTFIDWLRRDRTRSGEVAAAPTIEGNRDLQYDHYEINQRWQELAFVVDNHEISGAYQPKSSTKGHPFATPAELIDELENVLAPMELTLALQYLYALFSLKSREEVPADKWPTMADDVAFARQFTMLVAVGEMTHLRWANQILWELDKAGFYPEGRSYQPVLTPSKTVPSRGGEVPRQLRPLTRKALRAFIQVERPGGEIDNAYARCVATLKEPQYPPDLYELAVNIDSDGNDHFGRFRDIQRVFGAYDGAAEPYLRNVVLGTKEQTKAALDLYDATLAHLGRAYSAEAKSDYAAAQAAIDGARDNMHALEREAERLAKQGIGIPFWSE